MNIQFGAYYPLYGKAQDVEAAFKLIRERNQAEGIPSKLWRPEENQDAYIVLTGEQDIAALETALAQYDQYLTEHERIKKQCFPRKSPDSVKDAKTWHRIWQDFHQETGFYTIADLIEHRHPEIHRLYKESHRTTFNFSYFQRAKFPTADQVIALLDRNQLDSATGQSWASRYEGMGYVTDPVIQAQERPGRSSSR